MQLEIKQIEHFVTELLLTQHILPKSGSFGWLLSLARLLI